MLKLVPYVPISLGFLVTSPLEFGAVTQGWWKFPILAGLRDYGIWASVEWEYTEWPQGQRLWLLALPRPLPSSWP